MDLVKAFVKEHKLLTSIVIMGISVAIGYNCCHYLGGLLAAVGMGLVTQA